MTKAMTKKDELVKNKWASDYAIKYVIEEI